MKTKAKKMKAKAKKMTQTQKMMNDRKIKAQTMTPIGVEKIDLVNKKFKEAIAKAKAFKKKNFKEKLIAHPYLPLSINIKGEVFGPRKKRKLTAKPNEYRYITHGIGKGKSNNMYVHRLMIECFTGLILGTKCQVDHGNKIRSDNRAENLEVVTSAENNKRARENKKQKKASTKLAA